MELNITMNVMLLLVIGLASIGGGLVLYRGSRLVGWRAVGMSAVALGVGALLIVTLTLPVTSEGEAPEPVAEQVLVPAQPSEASATQQGPTATVVGDTPPVTGGGAPLASFTYEGMVYYGDSLGAANFNEDDFELVGSATEGNMVAPGGSLDVYMLKGDTDHVYTFQPGRSFLNEDGRTITIEDEWGRWSASVESAPDTTRQSASGAQLTPPVMGPTVSPALED